MEDEPSTFDRAFSDVVARHRKAIGATQDDVARAARTLGLDWKSITVTQLETERQHWKPLEVLLVPLILGIVGKHHRGEDFEAPTLPDLLRELHRVAPGYDGPLLARLATGESDPNEAGQSSRGAAALRWDKARYLNAESDPVDVDSVKVIWPDLSAKAIRAASTAQSGEAERKAALRLKADGLNVDALDIALAAQRLWRRSLTEERDARVAHELRERDLGARASQPLRGHVSRKLADDLRIELERRIPKPARAKRKQRAPARQPRTAKKTPRRLSAD